VEEDIAWKTIGRVSADFRSGKEASDRIGLDFLPSFIIHNTEQKKILQFLPLQL
jgi:hypothetical protein